MAIKKTVGFRSPYIGKTFQDLTSSLMGGDGYLSGAATSDNGATITVGAYAFVQAGVVVENDASTAGIAVPTKAEPWFLVASNPDDDPSSAPVVQVQTDPSLIVAGVVLAFKANGQWQNPVSLNMREGISALGVEPGVEGGVKAFSVLSGGLLDSLGVGRGLLVDSAGHRRDLPASTGTADILSASPLPPHDAYPRTDWIALRRREEASAEVKLLLGGLASSTATAPVSAWETGAGVKRPSFFAPRAAGAGRYYEVHGSGNNLRGAFSVNGAVPLMTLFAGAATIDHVWIAGRRSSDGAVIVVFAEGNAVKVGAFAEATGATTDAPVVIDTQANACIRIRAELDLDEQLHVVYQHDEGGAPPNQQIYYTKRTVVTGATFGNAAVTPRLVNIINSTKNDTWPSLAVDRKRQAHVAYSTGNGSDEFGELRYAVIDSTGVTISKDTYNTYGGQTDPADPVGIVAATIDNVRKPVVIVTPHDEVYVFAIGYKNGAGLPGEVMVFSPDFAARLDGFDVIQLASLFSVTAETLNALAVMCDELGQFHVGANYSTAGLLYQRLDTSIAPHGVLAESYLELAHGVMKSTTGAVTEMHARLGGAGEFAVSYLAATVASGALGFTRLTGQRFTPHRNDVFLAGINVDPHVGAPLTVDEEKFDVFSTRPKKMNYPILVGNEGDYQGYGALAEAVAAANRLGGHVVLRGGEHELLTSLTVRSGVSIEGEGLATIASFAAAQVAPWITLGSGGALAVAGVSGQIVSFAAPVAIRNNVRVGDLIVMATSGVHTIRRIVDANRVLVDGSGAPVGATCKILSCGMSFENVRLRFSASQAGVNALHAKYLYQGRLRGVRLEGTLSATSVGLFAEGCRDSIFEGIDTSALAGGGAGYGGVQLRLGESNTLRDSVLGNANGSCLFLPGAGNEDLRPRLSNCVGPDTGAVFVVGAARSSNLFMVSCQGNVTCPGGDMGFLRTVAAKVIKAPIGLDTLQLEDDNTLSDLPGALSLSASGAGNGKFNGATPGVITQSVNERLKKTGDTFTGAIITSNSSNLGDATTGRVGKVWTEDHDVSGDLDLGVDGNILALGYTTPGIDVPKARFRTQEGASGFVINHMGLPIGAPASFVRNEWEVSDLTAANAGVPLGWSKTRSGAGAAFDYENPTSGKAMFRKARLRIDANAELVTVEGPQVLPIVDNVVFVAMWSMAISPALVPPLVGAHLTSVFAGFCDQVSASNPFANAAPTKSIGFVSSGLGDPWEAYSRAGTNVSDVVLTGNEPLDPAERWRVFRIEVHGAFTIYGARTVRYFIDDTLVQETSGASVPSGTMEFIFRHEGLGGMSANTDLLIGPVYAGWQWFDESL